MKIWPSVPVALQGKVAPRKVAKLARLLADQWFDVVMS
jgi:hypothetical protein